MSEALELGLEMEEEEEDEEEEELLGYEVVDIEAILDMYEFSEDDRLDILDRFEDEALYVLQDDSIAWSDGEILLLCDNDLRDIGEFLEEAVEYGVGLLEPVEFPMIAAMFPVAIVEKIDEAIAAGLAETRSGFIREVVVRHFDAERSDAYAPRLVN